MISTNKKVSVVVPCYNVEKYLQECIDSLVDQTMQDIEIIFVNDASPDGCLGILRENERKYPDLIRVIDCKENRMQGAARNIGIRAASGEYIGFVDGDDFVHPEMYEKLYEKAQGCDVVFGKYMEVPEECDVHAYQTGTATGNRLPDWERVSALEGKGLDEQAVERIQITNLGGIWCGLWKKSILAENEVWFPEQIKYEDNYWASLIRCYLRRIAFASEALYFYRIRQTSTVRSRNDPKQYHRITAEQMLMEEVEKRGLWKPYRGAWEYIALKRYCFNTYFHFHQHMDDPDIKTLKAVIRDMKSRYPKWYKNRYLKEENSWKYRFLCRMIAVAPGMMSFLLRKVRFF